MIKVLKYIGRGRTDKAICIYIKIEHLLYVSSMLEFEGFNLKGHKPCLLGVSGLVGIKNSVLRLKQESYKSD